MTDIRNHVWDIAYAALLVIAIGAAVFHAAQARWPQAILVAAAAIVGAVLLISGWRREPEEQAGARPGGEPRPKRQASTPDRVSYERRRDGRGRCEGWISLGVLSGFVATGLMTGALLLGYAVSAIFASDAEGANQLRVWFSSLVDNTVTEVATVNLALAIGIHLVAGIFWAIIYTGFVEPRLSGGGLVKGMIYGLVPWILSVLVFFPLAGAGILGLDIGAGPLPIIGNLILHLVYGAALGKIYASNSVWDEPTWEISRENIEILDLAEKTMAIGLVPGAVLGALIAIIASTIVGSEIDTFMAAALGLLVGSAVGVWIGSLAGLSSNNRGEASAQRD